MGLARIQPHVIEKFVDVLRSDNERMNKEILDVREIKSDGLHGPDKFSRDMHRVCCEGNINQNNNMLDDLRDLLESYK